MCFYLEYIQFALPHSKTIYNFYSGDLYQHTTPLIPSVNCLTHLDVCLNTQEIEHLKTNQYRNKLHSVLRM